VSKSHSKLNLSVPEPEDDTEACWDHSSIPTCSGDQNRVSPYNISIPSSRQVMRMNKMIN